MMYVMSRLTEINHCVEMPQCGNSSKCKFVVHELVFIHLSSMKKNSKSQIQEICIEGTSHQVLLYYRLGVIPEPHSAEPFQTKES